MRKSILALTFPSIFTLALMACGDSGADADDSDNNWKKGGSSDPSVIIDSRDGEQYRTVRIGNQLWMAENLRFRDTLWMPDLVEKTKVEKEGVRYNYTAAMANSDYDDNGYNEGICPAGWHLPTMAEFDVLNNFVKEFCTSVDSCIKSKEGWNYPGNDKFGFGATYSSGTNGAFYWTSTPANGVRINKDHGYSYRSNSTDAVMYGVSNSYNYNDFAADFASKGGMYFVRCVKGSEEDSVAFMDKYLKTRDEMIEYLSSSAAYQAYLSSSSAAYLAYLSSSAAAEKERQDKAAKMYFNPDLEYSYVVDERDSSSYGYLQIGSYVWMAENSRYIPETYTNYLNKFMYSEDPNLFYETGVCYKYEDVDSACPTGWHTATSAEWNDLWIAAGEDYTNLLAKGAAWGNSATNATGFTMIPAQRTAAAVTVGMADPLCQTYFWTSTDSVRKVMKIDTLEVSSVSPKTDSLALGDSTESPTDVLDSETLAIYDTSYTDVECKVSILVNRVMGVLTYQRGCFGANSSGCTNIRCVKD